jgi:hypothetical protein
LPVEIWRLIGRYYAVFDALPESVVTRVFEHLNYSGRACLALTYRENARVAIENDSLESSKSADELTDELDEFFHLCDRDLRIEILHSLRAVQVTQKRPRAEAMSNGARQDWWTNGNKVAEGSLPDEHRHVTPLLVE